MKEEEEQKQLSQLVDDKAGSLALPFNKNQFADFLVSLLGKPQTITKNFRGYFEVNKDDLIRIYEQIVQRIKQQNDSKLIQFRATIYYDDNSTTTLNGFEHLVHYNERLPLVSVGIHLTWQFVVKFRDKDTFEKQEISVSFITANTDNYLIYETHEFYRPHSNNINFRIAHTARTWGADIEALLTKNLEPLIVKPNKFIEFSRYNSERIQNLYSAILFSITLGFGIFNLVKLNLPITEIPYSNFATFVLLLTATYIIQKLVFVILDIYETYSKPGYLLLTPESVKNKEKVSKQYNWKIRKYFATLVISIVAGILGNYIYYLMIN